MPQIITTIGPASEKETILEYFKEHSVAIARMNFSHNTSTWHNEIGLLCRDKGFEIMVDLAGPKVLLGKLHEKYTVHDGDIIYFEKERETSEYPYEMEDGEVFPCAFDIHKFAVPGDTVLIDDGKVETLIESVIGKRVRARVIFGGQLKSHKGMNFPDKTVDINFLVDRDLEMLGDVIPVLRPEIIAPSFVRGTEDLDTLEEYIQKIAREHNMGSYTPKICVKMEVGDVVEDENLERIVKRSDIIMIARGDLALETQPIHSGVPFFQEKMKRSCLRHNKPFIVATQILESMMDSPVPTRAEVSDLYRAVVLDKADYVMLSGESAAGKFPKRCVHIMHSMITQADELSERIL